VQENKERGLHVNPAVRKTTFLSHLYIKTNTLPRQARDKHRESTQNRCRFSQGTVAFNNYRIGDQQLRAYAEGLRRLGDQVRHSPLFCFSGPLDSNRPDGNRCFIKTGSGYRTHGEVTNQHIGVRVSLAHRGSLSGGWSWRIIP
jgi:hypothetical protein